VKSRQLDEKRLTSKKWLASWNGHGFFGSGRRENRKFCPGNRRIIANTDAVVNLFVDI
jgi:hypothetical protein